MVVTNDWSGISIALANGQADIASVLSLLQSLARSRKLAVLCTLHQPQLAERFADRIVTM